ncbi:40S ribosomal protein S3-1 [Datura stramonium]|uniref:40S ribosomal protein S3-1 n=1 Tax=Datura stramonium TaxID=4076 RepID=A0ABS8VEB7_DATST|nr:40S ribosomal protein S3-1 [Datura stramonium]
MAVSKNKRISKGKKRRKKKVTNPYAKKDWYDIKAPSVFEIKNIGKTLVTRTRKDEDQAFRKIQLRAEDVKGRNVLTNFHGMDFTTDKLKSLVRKWQTLIETHVMSRLQTVILSGCSTLLLQRTVQRSVPVMLRAARSVRYRIFAWSVKILKAPKFDLGKLMEVHGDYLEDVGVKLDRPADETVAEAEPEVPGA